MLNTLYFEPNKVGIDYVVGDIHGCFDKLMSSLEKISFDKEKDRLFCTGDLVDRGPDSLKCLEVLKEAWFFSVKGNHEKMVEDMIKNPADREKYELWCFNGGHSWEEIPGIEVLELITPLPDVIKIREGGEGGGVEEDIVIVHAEYPNGLKEEYSNHLWGRDVIRGIHNGFVEEGGVKAVICGHTPVDNITIVGKHIFIDTGSVFYKDKDLLIFPIKDIYKDFFICPFCGEEEKLSVKGKKELCSVCYSEMIV